jgi:hypothetical protein
MIMISDEVLEPLKWRWTTHIHEFTLIHHVSGYAIQRQDPSGNFGALIIEDNDVNQAVINKMIEAGVEVIDGEESRRRYMARRGFQEK